MSYVELTGLDDGLLLPWLDLYETAFPPHEKILVSAHLEAIKARTPEQVFLAALAFKAVDARDSSSLGAPSGESPVAGQFAGLARYELFPSDRVVNLWYLAISPALRSQGLGSQLYREILRRIGPGGYRAMFFEVEIPELQDGDAGRALAARRIQFYRRQGALLLGGIHYLQSVGWHQPLTPMHLMVHPLEPLTPEGAFDLGRRVYQDYLAQAGELTLA